MNDAERKYLGDQARKLESSASRLYGLADAFDTLHLRGPHTLLLELHDDLDTIVSSIRYLINQPPSKGNHDQ